jgi:hypothetical protein
VSDTREHPSDASESPAEQRAAREGLAVLALITFDLVNVAQGHPMIVQTVDGTEMLLRLATADEVLEFQRAAIEKLPEYCRRPPLMSRFRAQDLVTPLGGAR